MKLECFECGAIIEADGADAAEALTDATLGASDAQTRTALAQIFSVFTSRYESVCMENRLRYSSR